MLSLLGAAIFLCFTLGAASICAGQPNPKKTPKWMTRNFLTLGWNTALPIGPSFTQTPTLSVAGAHLGFHFRLNKRLSIGPEVAWQLLESRYRFTTLQSQGHNGSLVSWTERRFLSLGISTQIYFFKRDTMLPYVAIGLGALRVVEKKGLDFFNNNTPNWHPKIYPELGFIVLHGRIPFCLNIGLHVATPTQKRKGEILSIFSFGIAIPN